MIENIVRAVIINDNKILVVKRRGKNNTFLPGGHIEHFESVPVALIREINEEIGMDCEVNEFLGCIENSFPDDNGDLCHEIGLYFNVKLLNYSQIVISNEDHLEFFWSEIDKLEDINLQPSSVLDIIYSKNNSTTKFLTNIK
ncbi:MAG: NUDIX domain-containing protein [Candidatus Delongbacteria bacterium]|nr:NUDIX domain-containing protein [Candidatus Delongbacteria bacterium]